MFYMCKPRSHMQELSIFFLNINKKLENKKIKIDKTHLTGTTLQCHLPGPRETSDPHSLTRPAPQQPYRTSGNIVTRTRYI